MRITHRSNLGTREVNKPFSVGEMVSQIHFDLGDATEVRFCVSPLRETVTSFWALANPSRHVVHLPWIEQARALPGQEVIASFVRNRGWLPDFLTPPPSDPSVDFADELAVVAATPHIRVREEILQIHPTRPFAPYALDVAADPARHLPIVVEALQAWHDAAIAPHWPRWRELLEADIAYRARQLAAGGLRQFFETLHPSLTWTGDRLISDDPWGLSHRIRGPGFAMIPSVFADDGPLWNVRDDSPPCGVYAARAVATLWESHGNGRSALSKVVGPTRASLLTYAAEPCTTTRLAQRTGLTQGAVSQHLAVLREAGLVSKVRQGREVFYCLTGAGVALVDGDGAGGAANGNG